MTITPTAAEMFHFIEATFDAAKLDDEIVAKLDGLEATLKVITTDPDGVLIIDTARQEAREGDVEEEADATLHMTTTAANLFWQGQLNLLAAITRGVVKVRGKKTVLVRVLPIASKLFPIYTKILLDEGREDLLVDKARSTSA